MPVIDCDAHFQEPLDWLERRFPELARELPAQNIGAVIASLLGGDALASIPPDRRPQLAAFLPEAVRPMADAVLNMSLPDAQRLVEGGLLGPVPQGAWEPEERLALMDEQGVDIQILLPTIGFFRAAAYRRENPDAARRALAAYNTWACETVDGYTDRLIPCAMVDFNDIEWTVGELRRTAALGSRAYVFWDAGTVGGRSMAHPDFDAIWSTSVEAGMMPIIHVGAGRPTLDPGWLDDGGDDPLRGMLLYLTQTHQVAELPLTALIVGGVFERFPELVVLVAELGIEWVPGWLERLRGLGQNPLVKAQWDLPLMPEDYARRNVRFTPLDPASAVEVINQVGPGLVCFSSDYPHPEGTANAPGAFRQALSDKVSDAARREFFGDTIARALGIEETTSR